MPTLSDENISLDTPPEVNWVRFFSLGSLQYRQASFVASIKTTPMICRTWTALGSSNRFVGAFREVFAMRQIVENTDGARPSNCDRWLKHLTIERLSTTQLSELLPDESSPWSWFCRTTSMSSGLFFQLLHHHLSEFRPSFCRTFASSRSSLPRVDGDELSAWIIYDIIGERGWMLTGSHCMWTWIVSLELSSSYAMTGPDNK